MTPSCAPPSTLDEQRLTPTLVQCLHCQTIYQDSDHESCMRHLKQCLCAHEFVPASRESVAKIVPQSIEFLIDIKECKHCHVFNAQGIHAD